MIRYAILLYLAMVSAKSILEPSDCGVWSEWSGECHREVCGLCRIQQRARLNGPNCVGEMYQYRNCLHTVCLFPCLSCEKGCNPTIFQGRHVCSGRNATIHDKYDKLPENFKYGCTNATDAGLKKAVVKKTTV